MLKPLLASLAVSTLIGGCAITPHTEKLKYAPLIKQEITFVPEHTSTYLREVTPDEDFLSQKVSFVGSVSLVDALRLKLPNNSIIPKDSNIDLSKTLNMIAKDMYVRDYLEYLSSLSGYEISLNNGKVEIRSFVNKQWNLAMFSSKRDVRLTVGRPLRSSKSGGGDSTTNEISTVSNDDEWLAIVDGAKRILNVQDGGSEETSATRVSPYIQAVRSVGTISAGGAPQRMKAVDEFISSIAESGSKQINISVKAYDVTLNDDRGAGIDWDQLASVNGSFNGNPLNFGFQTVKNGIFDSTNTLFQGAGSYSSSKVNAGFILNFLSKFGEVELLNQPNVTVRNGGYAYISSGEESTYIGKIEVTGADGVTSEGVVNRRVEKTLESVRVGVTLSVTPRILSDGRILLDIWPVVSSMDGSDVFEIEGETQVVPRISLQELSTQVIAESGKPIQLGGFIRRAISKKLEELPWREKLTGAILKPIFGNETQGVERRELVLTVTPTILEGA